jgi:hypothetical protein
MDNKRDHQNPRRRRKKIQESSSTTGTGNKIYNLVMAFLYIRGQLGPDHWGVLQSTFEWSLFFSSSSSSTFFLL